ncbi:MAG TPA: twin-arginine translocation signal domain-containing protein, partial [Chthoniobacterales bacterium]|nr:twin-arginine translocation signal domain-containing protein [Chthoniobacterales bacterium]
MIRPIVGRRSFLKGLGATGEILVPASALLINQAKAQEDKDKKDDGGGKLSKGDASILRFVATAEILESDLWE